MFDRLLPWLKITCLLLAGLMVYQAARLLVGRDRTELAGLDVRFPEIVAPPVPPGDGTKAASAWTAPAPETPPATVQDRIDRIERSGILGAVPRPLPLALLGIGGEDAFVRAPNGQTGLLRVGEELGGIKLLRIGINRVVIEEAGQEKELTLFPDLGGPSILSK